MAFHKTAAGVLCLSAMSLMLDVSYAETGRTARDAALESLKSQLLSGSDSFAESADAARWGDIRAAAAAREEPGDAVSRRLESVFDMVVPEAADTAAPRLPVARPALRDDDALAYAAHPSRTAPRTRGATAIEDLVELHAQANDVPPALAQALVQVESSHNPKATGRNGEIGLLQIKPKTARAMGYKGPAKGLYDPETNLTWGMKYLGKAHDLSGGDVCGTLLRYNAGLDARRKSAASNKFCSKVKKVMAKRA